MKRATFGFGLGAGGLLWLGAVAAGAPGCGRTPLGLGPRSDVVVVDDDGGVGGSGAGAAGGSDAGGGGGQQGGGDAGGGGEGPGCVVDADCDDADICTVDRCDDGTCITTPLDADADGQVSDACGGPDCNDLNPSVFVGASEQCTDAADNDCNGVADCFDPACDGAPVCGCTPAPGGEVCQNSVDDDCDTTVDCNDTDCINTPACGCLADEIGACGDGFDNDCDNTFDCDDTDCAFDAQCQCQAIPESCDNGLDEDCDLLVDCADPDCTGTTACSCVPPGSPELCTDAVDNDCDGLVDCADPSCAVSMACANCTPEVCNDGVDNDCDGVIDCADGSCVFAPNCAPVPEQCNNGLDDDNDGLVDCDDPDCSNNPVCVLAQQNCLTALPIPGSGTYTGTTEGNVGANIGACGGGAGEAVFSFVLTEPSFVGLDSIGTSFDSVLYVRQGSCDLGVEIGCDDDSANSANAARLEFPLLLPGTYFIFLDGFTIDPNFGANDGPFVLNVQIMPSPSEVCGDGID
ncbi:MAG: PPC domain-containing protein, partial [Myxococcota bacterium]